MLIVFTGNGKGKTTAALGQVFRMLGRGKRALVIQFIKGPWKSGEDELVKKIKNHSKNLENKNDELDNLFHFDIKKKGLGFVGILGDDLPREEHEKAATEAFQLFLNSWPQYDLIVLDELNVALSLKLLSLEKVIEELKAIPDEKFVLSTGRDAPQLLIDAAHLVTEMREIKHPFNDGRLAQIALEF
ncbi:MAG: cob(I)yrinic acid a,c-diamide adenosyltransferase [Anaplasmataceae bacterium]|nr:cob(I)yrinic acid a,c-diamide adenosyltransferase [Anaplasmataceae bacterium]